MASKIRIKMGDVEVEYEGSEEFLRDELKSLLSAVLDLHKEHGNSVLSDDLSTKREKGVGSSNNFTGTTNTVAAKLSSSSGTDLVIAAAAQLCLVSGNDSFNRATLLKEMQTAKSYYKTTYCNNLSKYLKSLVSTDRLREVAKDTYSLSAKERKTLETKLDS